MTVLTRMANCDDVTLYAEIKADGNNKITDIEARLTAAEGKMIEYNGKDTSDSDKEKYADIGNIRWFSVQTENSKQS